MKKIIKLLLLSALICVIMICAVMSASAVEYTDGYYTYAVTNGEATITNVDTSISGDVTVPATLGGCPVVKIGDYAFDFCDKITSVTFPECLVEIGNYAFVDCHSIKNFTVVGNGLIDTCKLETIGENAFLRCTALEAVDIPDSVTDLGECAFAACYTIADIKLGEGITIIRFSTFDWCQKITRVDVGDNVQTIEGCAFNNCANLKTVRIGENVSHIEPLAFTGCANLENIEVSANNDYYISKDGSLYTTLQDSESYDRKPHTLIRLTKNAVFNNTYTIPVDLYWIEPDAVEDVGFIDYDTSVNCGYFYKSNSSLMHCVDYSPNPTNITMVKYLGDEINYTIPSDVDQILHKCFSGAGFEKVIIPESITSLSTSMFFRCRNLKEVVLPSTLTEIGYWCFQDCEKLETIVVPDGVTEIGPYVFCNCISLKNFTMPKNIKKIGERAFGNTGIEEMIIPETVTEIDKYAFSHLTKKIVLKCDLDEISDFVFYNCSGLETVVFEGTIGKIGKSAFEGCGSLKNINIPSTVTEIDESAFLYCWSLESITLPEKLEKISDSTFKYCSALTEITIPATVTEIEDDAFMNVDYLKYVYFGGTQEQWNGMIIGKNNDALNKATIIFADGVLCRSHTDNNKDGKCDICGSEFCSCKCHKSGISSFIWKILCFFYRLFKTNGTCACGAAHY